MPIYLHGNEITALGINELTDVDTATITPKIGDNLTWDGTAWVAGSVGIINPVNTFGETHTLTDENSGSYLVFNFATDATLTVPEGLLLGHNSVIMNIGNGNLTIVLSGSDTAIGELDLKDPNGMMSLQKIAVSKWHTSERI